MAKYRNGLPQMSGDLFLRDGGLETTLAFVKGFALPEFASFNLVNDDDGREVISSHLQSFAAVARDHSVGLILGAPTWRASRDWGTKLGYTGETLADAIHKSVELVGKIRNEFENANTPIVIEGTMGSRADGYNPKEFMTTEQAEEYHSTQIGTFLDTDVDMVAAYTMAYVDEVVGMLAHQVEGISKALAPVDTGALKNSINSKRIKRNHWRWGSTHANQWCRSVTTSWRISNEGTSRSTPWQSRYRRAKATNRR